jgi:hypothetical protein
MEEGMRFHFKEYRRDNKGVVQEVCQELQWERCMTRYLKAFVGGMGHQIVGGMGNQVHERSWGAWLVQIDSEFLIGRHIGTNVQQVWNSLGGPFGLNNLGNC